MTELLSRPILRVTAPKAPPDRPVVLVAAVGAAAVAVSSLLLFLAVAVAGWFAADSGTVGDAMRVGALGWLAGNGSSLEGSGVSVHAIPLGFLLIFGYALQRVGRWAVGTSWVPTPWYVAWAALAMAAVYAAAGALTALVASVGDVHAPLPRTVAAFVLVGGGFGAAGLLSGTGTGAGVIARLPSEARAVLLGGAGGVLAMLGMSAVVLAVSLILHSSTATTLAQGTGSGIVGSLVLAIVGAALVPNAVLCAGAYVAGPGFAVGTGTQVSPTGLDLGLLPDFPLLAALPTSADAWWLPALIVLPVIAGGAAGLLAVRRFPAEALERAALRGALAGMAGGAAFGLLTFAATGSIAPGRLQHVGPDVLATTAVCLVAFALGGTVAAAGRHALSGQRHRRDRKPEPEPAFAPAQAETTADDGNASAPQPIADEELTQPIKLP